MKSRIGMGVLIWLVVVSVAQAQPGGGNGLEFSLSGLAPANVGDGKGEAETLSANFGVSWSKLRFGYEYTGYSWEYPEALPFGDKKSDPWQALHFVSLGMADTVMMRESWGYFYQLAGTAGFEEELSDSLGAMGFAGVLYNLPDSGFSFRLGAGAMYNEVDTLVLPVVGIDWRSLGMGEAGFSASLGFPVTRLSYHFSPISKISIGLTAQGGTYRLADESPTEPEGYLETRDFLGFVSMAYQPFENFEVTVGGQFAFEREYTLYDANGDNERDYDIDDAGGGFVRVSFGF